MRHDAGGDRVEEDPGAEGQGGRGREGEVHGGARRGGAPIIVEFDIVYSPAPIRVAAVLLAPGARGGVIIEGIRWIRYEFVFSPEAIRVAAVLLAPGPRGGLVLEFNFRLVYSP